MTHQQTWNVVIGRMSPLDAVEAYGLGVGSLELWVERRLVSLYAADMVPKTALGHTAWIVGELRSVLRSRGDQDHR